MRHSEVVDSSNFLSTAASRGWKWLGRASRFAPGAAALLVGSMLSAPPAVAAVSTISVAIPPLIQNVSPSTSTRPTKLAWNVVLTNNTTSNVSNAWIKITTKSTKSSPVVFLTDLTAAGDLSHICTPDTAGTTVTCLAGALAANGGSFTFKVVFAAPSVETDVQPYYGIPNGQGAGGNDPNTSAVGQKGQDDIIHIVNPINNNIISYLLPGDGLFVNQTAKINGKTTEKARTTIIVPQVSTAAIAQQTSLQCLSSMFKECFVSDLNVNGGTEFTSGFLYIELVRDKVTIQGNQDIANLSGTIFVRNSTGGLDVIPDCDLNTSPPAPSSTIVPPAVDTRKCLVTVNHPYNATKLLTYVDPVTKAWHATVVAFGNRTIEW